MRNVLVTGGAGYVGSVLVPKLLSSNYHVRVFDLLIYGADVLHGAGVLPEHPELEIIKGDIRDTEHLKSYLSGVDTVVHLACISNDPSFYLNPELSKSINYDCFEPMVRAARDSGVSRFLYVSTSSVYGVSEAPDVTEEHPLVPLTDYNKFKGMCEPILLEYESPTFTTTIMRPATICGYSPRMRLDLSVNILTNHAVNKRKITVFGGSQKRPNIHIDDITDLYVQLLNTDKSLIAGEIFNAAYQNNSIKELALIVKKIVEEEMPELAPIDIETASSDDIRSYHVSSEKIYKKLGYKPKRTIEDAVRGLCAAFREGKLPNSFDDSIYFNVKRMQEIELK